MKNLKQYLSKCTVVLDTYNMDACIAYLNNAEGVEVAKIDYTNEIETCESSIFLDGDEEMILTITQMEYIVKYLDTESESLQKDWLRNHDDDYDVREDQGY